ncbi:sulfatase-like hydrolase/transferase [Haloferula rosea]|uniref:Sulfatase-like hydrolase/transferase n=1 Tax=Haloferula rosea TaxID=490093 RepID=A0A934VFS9_9BACT|nr:sulfatase-like hydrolase/transferase [Haloferula rosea]MBK1827312.1 sulfatase-like hydrolase/transferase [Haloferula rosea]
MKAHQFIIGLLGLTLTAGSLHAAELSALDAELSKAWPDNRTINIVFHGHSVPSGYHRAGEVKPFESYPYLFGQQLKQRYPNAVVNIITTSIGGEHSIDGAARFSTDVFAQQPDLILIDYAINDRSQAIPAVETAWQSMIDEAQTAGVPVILLTPTGVSGEDLSNPGDPLTERADLIRDLADTEDVLLADVSAAWLAEIASGTPEANLLSQGNHPNLAGHQLAADTIWTTFSNATSQSTITVNGPDFPNDGSTASFVSPDGLVVFQTSTYFSGNGNFIGDAGGNNVNAWDLNDTLTVEFEGGVGLTEINTRWTTGNIVISGFTEDPGATITRGGAVVWNSGSNTLTLTMSWDAGVGDGITFSNPAASDGQTLNFSFAAPPANRQTAVTSFVYRVTGTPAPDPLVHYTFDTGSVSGTTVSDASGNGNNATIVPSGTAPVTDEPGLFEQSFRFVSGDDPGGIVSIPASTVPSGNSPRTFSMWFKQAAEAGQDKLFGYGNNAAGQAIDFGLEAGGLRIRHWGGSITYGTGFDFAGTDGGWHHVALRVGENATTFADVDVFLDGRRLLPEAGGATSVALNTANSSFAIGSSATPASALGFDGYLDEFMAWDSALTGIQIQELAEAPPVPTIVQFSASPQNRVPSGSAVTLSWTTENATTLTLNPGMIDVTGLTSTVVNPTEKTTYTLTASDGTNLDATDEVIINVGAEPYPNVIVFFLDDFGWSDWEQNGASTGSVFHETPNMNQLAAEGMYFPNGYASTPVCSPTRGSLLTGQSPAYNKLTDWISGAGDAGKSVREAEWIKKLSTDTPNFGSVLRECGYRALHIGKWHLGAGTSAEANPLNHGFEFNVGGNQFGTPPAPERYFASANGFSGLPNMGPDIAPPGSYLTDVLTEQAVEQIQLAAEEDTAFVMYLSHFAVHTPIQAPAATVAKYQAKLDNNPGMDWQGQTNPTYAAMVEHVDLSLGAIMATLADPDGDPMTDDSIAENTMIVFTADNGGLLSATSNRPLRDGKGGNYEGGIREPWVFWWPGTIAPGINPEPIVSHDLFPTILSKAGIPVPEGHEVNGQDLSPLLEGTSFEREEPLVFHYPHWSPQGGSPYSAIRQGDWKLLYNYTNASWELYNLAEDIGETTNRISTEADRQAVLSWALANGLENLDANYPRNVSTLAEEPPVPLVSPENDQDGDGRDDLQETLEGTDPLDAQSYFAPVPMMDSGTFSMAWLGVEGRRYQLEVSETLTANSWFPLETFGPLATAEPVQFEDIIGPLSPPSRFYRIVTDLP